MAYEPALLEDETRMSGGSPTGEDCVVRAALDPALESGA